MMRESDVAAAHRGVYSNVRASALAGVPSSTMYYWARKGLLTPSISAEKLKLWSWADLVAMRAIYWLRHPVPGEERRPTPMRMVRSLLEWVEQGSTLGEAIARGSLVLSVDSLGTPYIGQQHDSGLSGRQKLDLLPLPGVLLEGTHGWKQAAASLLIIDILASYPHGVALRGPNLIRPREGLRIVPGKLSGEPHIEDTRIETRILWALYKRGFANEQILSFYPDVTVEQLGQAIDLEQQLEHNIIHQAA